MQNRFIRLFFAALLTCSVATIPSLAQGNGKAKGHDKKDTKDKDDDRGPEQYQFRQQDREYVSSYYLKHGKSKGMPPGQAKKNGDLPPGLEKQLQRNGTLPPGLEKKMQPCPVEITRQLPPLPPEYQRGVVGASIVIFNRKTNIVVDVMADVVR
jgi:hypothetical protein